MARDPKKFIEKNIRKAVEDFQNRPGVKTKYGEPIVGYVSMFHPLYDHLYMEGLCEHPKKIYNPGHTIIVHYVPVAGDAIRELEEQGRDSQQWKKAHYDSIMLSQFINMAIRDSLVKLGRISSISGVATDWNRKMHMPMWSSKITAYLAGIGELGPAGSFHTKDGYIGSIGSTMTDGFYAEDCPVMNGEEIEAEIKKIKDMFQYEGLSEAEADEEMKDICPAGAIGSHGIKREACLAYCESQNKKIPDPGLCGMCFRFKK